MASKPSSIIPEIDIREKLPEIEQMGWVKSMRKSDTGIGYTFETLMGIKENNKRNHDFTYQNELVESKCQRIGTNSMLTLFTKEACVRLLNDVQLMRKYGYWDDIKKRYALMDTCVYGQFNQRGLTIAVDKEEKTIDMKDKEGNLVWQWLPSDIVLKFKNLLLVLAERKMLEGIEYFHYYEAFYLQHFKETRFLELIEEKKIVVDLRMHLKTNGASRNHGTGFRTRHLKDLMVCYAKSDKVL